MNSFKIKKLSEGKYQITGNGYNAIHLTDEVGAKKIVQSLQTSSPVILLDEPSQLQHFKEQKRAQILAEFSRNIENKDDGLIVEAINARVDCGRIHAENVASMITLLTNTAQSEIAFRVYDNTTMMLSLEQLKAVQTAIISQGFKLYEKKWQLEEAIKNAKDKDELKAIVW